VTFEEYYELTERTGWRTTDLDWDELRRDQDAGRISDFDEQALLGTAVIEHGVPHYSEVWTLVEGLREHWELWQFTTLWTGEEHRHSYVLKKTCDALGITDRIVADLAAVTSFPFARTQKASCPSDCYRSVPGMLAYTVIQELATNKFYALAARRTKSPFLRRLLLLIAGDEMRHHVFYRDAMRDLHRTAEDRDWYCDEVYKAGRSFRMPHLIYDLQMEFFEHGDWTIGKLGRIAFKAQLARSFGFDAKLLHRLVTDNAAHEVERSGDRVPTPRVS
jgi:hypothetical protein